MSTKTETDRPTITLTTLDERKVEIDLAAIDAAGLIFVVDADEHCGHDIDAAYNEGEANGRASAMQAPDSPSAIVMERWHNEHHPSVYRLCYEQPCLDLRRAGDPYP
jgi:hypothetical protein